MKWFLLAMLVLASLASLLAQIADASWPPNGQFVCGADWWRDAPLIVTDGTDGAIIVWLDGRSGGGSPWLTDVYAQRIASDGTVLWQQDGVAITDYFAERSCLRAIPDGAGGAIIACMINEGDVRSVYAQRIDGSGSLMWGAGGRGVVGGVWPDYLEIATDGAHGVIAAYLGIGGVLTGTDVWAQRLSAPGYTCWGGGVPVCTATGDQLTPALVQDGCGGAVMAWEDGRSGPADVYAQRVDSTGSSLWSENGIPVCATAGSRLRPRVTAEGGGGAIVTWEDYRVPSGDIYAQRISDEGNVLWAPDGVGVCIASGSQFSPRLVGDGSEGCIVTWQDYRIQNDANIYAQRIDSSGAARWVADGVGVCTENNSQDFPELAAIPGGGAIIVWQDSRADGGDIYAQEIDADGDTLWTANGAAVCTAAYDQARPQLIQGSQAAIFAWVDNRTFDNNTRIYAGSISDVLGVDGPVVPLPDFLSQNFPNPFNPATTMEFVLEKPSQAKLRIYDTSGRCVRALVNEVRPAGRYAERWDGDDDLGAPVVSGVYFYRLEAGDFVATRKMVLLR
jgi:hypothetical protein